MTTESDKPGKKMRGRSLKAKHRSFKPGNAGSSPVFPIECGINPTPRK